MKVLVLFTGMWQTEEAESELDDYAIPDEPESYASNRTVEVANSHEDAHKESNETYVSAYGMTPQEAADEDRIPKLNRWLME